MHRFFHDRAAAGLPNRGIILEGELVLTIDVFDAAGGALGKGVFAAGDQVGLVAGRHLEIGRGTLQVNDAFARCRAIAETAADSTRFLIIGRHVGTRLQFHDARLLGVVGGLLLAALAGLDLRVMEGEFAGVADL